MKVPRYQLERVVDTIVGLREFIRRDVERVIARGAFIGGEEVEAFEAESTAFLGVDHAVSCNSGTDALELALRTLSLGPGSVVGVPALTFAATCSAIHACGHRWRFLDVDPDTFQIAPQALADALPELDGVVAVSLYGRPLDDEIFDLAEAAAVPVVEDACQSFSQGAPGQWTRAFATCFSFFPTKPLGAFGDGGLMVTNDDGAAARARALARHGFLHVKHRPEFPGRNSRLDALQAAVLRAKLPHVPTWQRARTAQAQRYRDELADVVSVPAMVPHHAWHLYTVRTPDRDARIRQLEEIGIECVAQYSPPLHRTPAFSQDVSLPSTEVVTEELLCLPITASMSHEQQGQVISAVREVCA